ncbi:hypothetical protein PCANC_25479 [Puccinia coronata f. sp. avenae]|uniref:Uncharacterized protein n=1 Tax=Puccinia coronata f. sp. avenae TaxID=200324 RepID=A0A2N5SP80_9BASI|nr:hypothetical protein PCANC_25479 [Puccinia coronata f. sp. avenae]
MYYAYQILTHTPNAHQPPQISTPPGTKVSLCDKLTPSSNVSPEQHRKLLEYWIKRLKREKEEYLRTYKPSPHDLLSYKEKLQRALDKIRTRKEAELNYQIAFNALLREHRATRRQRKLERMASNNTAASTDTATNKTIVPNYLNQPIKIITTPFLTGKTLTTTNTNKDSTANNDNLEDLIDYEDPNSPGYSPHQRELNDETAPSQTLTKRVKALKVSRIQPIRQETPVSMEIDDHSPLQEATRSPQTSTKDDLEIITEKKTISSVEPLSKKETIAMLVKAHVALRDRFDHAQKMNDEQAMKILLFRAQESQKELQKLITNREIETYVQGWNPWTEKRKLFPPAQKKETGKKRSSTSRNMKYDDADRWAEVANIAMAVQAMYKHAKGRE